MDRGALTHRVIASLGAALLVASVAHVPLASGAEPRGRAGATERFEAAQALFDQGKFAEALDLFRGVYEETKSPNAHLMVARALLAQSRTADAYDELYATMREAAGKAASDPKYAKTRDAAAAQIAKLELQVGKVVVVVLEPNASATLNGAPLAAARLGVPMAIAPGPFVVAATRKDGTTVQRAETIAAGETKTITLVFGQAAAPVLVAPAPPPSRALPPPRPPVEAHPEGLGPVRIGGIAVAGLGVVSMAVFGATFAIAQSKYDTLKTGCGTMRCTSPSYDSVIDTGKQMQLVSNVTLVAGLAALGAGATMIGLGGPKSATPTPKDAWVVLAPSVHGAALGLGGAF